MTSCTIIISHYESPKFLHACIRQIRKYANENVKQHIVICDQSSDETYGNIWDLQQHSDISIIHTKPYYSGYGIDVVMRNANIETEYIAQIHADAFPVHKNWLLLPIKLIEEYSLSFVGQLQFISKPTDTIYPTSSGFFAMSQCYNVAKTSTYREMSLEAGFTRFHNRPQSGLEFKNNDWSNWASDDYENKGSDDDVVAFAWEDKHREHNKLGLAVTGFIEPSFGRIIEDIVFHFGSANEAIGVMDSMPEMYKYFTKKINEDYSDELIDYMVSLAKISLVPETQILTRNFWDGNAKQSFPPTEALNKRIEELKNI